MKTGRLKFWLPAAVFVALTVFLAIGLTRNPEEVPSPLIGKPAPTFELPRLASPGQRFSPANMKGQVWVLNVWASWCVSCRAEHEVLEALAERDIAPIVGLNYKDKPGNARQWLVDRGDPYALSVMDRDGKAGIDWGVYGVPETFIIDRRGNIRYKHIGPIDFPALTDTVIPKLQSLAGES